VTDGSLPGADEVRVAEVVAALSLATDLGMGFPLEHSLYSAVVAMRLAGRLGVDAGTASQTYYGGLLSYIGCTADAEIAAGLFEEGALLKHFAPVMFGSPAQTMAGVIRALAGSHGPAPVRAVRGVARLPGAARGHRSHRATICEVGQMLTDRLGLPGAVSGMFAHLTERWDGTGEPKRLRGVEIPLAMRIVHVATDAALQRLIGGADRAARVIRERAGHAFDPAIATLLAENAQDVLAFDEEASAWDEALALEPRPHLCLMGDQIERALAAMGDFTDLLSPSLVGHSSGVADLAAAAAARCRLRDADVTAVRRAGFVHDVGRVAISAYIWQKPTALTPDEWERVRLHAYYTERVLARSPFLAAVVPTTVSHHERLDGSGYHRGLSGAALPLPARILAAADAYQAMTQPRPYRAALTPRQAADAIGEQARAGRLAPDAVSAVLEAAGQPTPRLARPAGLTEREVEVVAMLARGLQTKQIAHALGISVKTADRHVQNAYAKMGISTRAAAALFAMQHGLATWGELPIVSAARRS
jgi:HD-GYP domain-containing protein (c-di-GMP phosphodiesterase class II)